MASFLPPALPRVSSGNGALPGGPGAGVPGAGLLPGVAVVGRRLGLSTREMQIVELLLCELKDRAIAHQLGISYKTLRTQFSRLYRKLGVQTRVGVAVFSEAMRIVAEEQVQE